MLTKIHRWPQFPSSEITDPKVYMNRRAFMTGAAALALLPAAGEAAAPPPPAATPLKAARNPTFSLNEPPTDFKSVTTYNNFYEFGLDKDDPARHAHLLRTRPWTVEVGGHVAKPKTFDIEDLLRLAPMEERVYALRCVEAWSMVIPWVGYPLAALLKRVEPTSQAKYVEFQTLVDPEQFPGQRKGFFGFTLDWPYT
jgi:sulfoxide reductase catalytic subunit YedY